MKNFITAILAVFYLASSSGATIHLHYCMGKLAETGLSKNKSKSCSKCGMKKSEKSDNGCCKDEHKFFKDNSAQKLADNNLQLLQIFSAAIPATYIELPSINFPSVTEANPISHAPPREQGLAIYILKRSFLI